uniref:alpha/beta fold hydrolase n=1 Tax=Flavobacterium sp. TaxID=239 RepID=UPI00404A0D01
MISHTVYNHKESKEWVTFIHGAGGSSSIWFKQIRAFQKHFNVLLLDLRGHGNSKNIFQKAVSKKYTFTAIAGDVHEVLDHLKIESSHFVGISLGTIVIRQLAEMHPKMVKSMSLGGAIMKMNFRSQILMRVGSIFKYVLPYLVLYRLFAFIIMPKKNHKNSRILFINEAKKLYQKEFIRWFKLTAEINPLLRWFRQVELEVPTLYIMGEQDYMFLPTIRKIVSKHAKTSQLFVVQNSGHVVNVEQPMVFNDVVISFIQKNA